MRALAGLAWLLLVASVAVTSTRFLDVAQRGPAAVAAVSSYAAVGFGLALLLALVALARTRWRGVAVLAVLALVGVGVHAAWAAPAYVADGADGDGPQLRLLTANLQFGQSDPERVLATVRRERVQLLVLEELTPPALARFEALGLSTTLPYTFGDTAFGGAGTVVRSAFPLREGRLLPLTNTGLEMLVDAPGGTLRLVAAHTAQPFNDARRWSDDLRLLRRAVRRQVAGGPTVVAGDLNATTGHRQLREVLDAGVTDAVDAAGSGWQPTWPNGFGRPWTRPVVAIDHVLTSRELTTVRTATVDQPGSDHRALLAVIARR